MTSTTQVVGRRFLFDFGPTNQYEMHFTADDGLDVTVIADPGYPSGTLNTFTVTRTEVRPDLWMVTWTEPDTGNTVSHVQDFAAGTVWTNITDLASGAFWNLRGTITPRP
ncbi:MoaF N-terminal domain-containing protein [Streptomyces sp. VRA16 Mangrove soil]|uniref:MoaF-related domain-containing protein n=1 Tax=Streptomyces sp. VRA16 Mangrove soil TaxID=2817434 RepID=UPI001A9FCC0D|nr:MoaF N-terminal domain-containing protein [Streptomyces sp. VRA16 Mangrove soil]MBO1330284.1 MoaF N-terminal domain-containing protein [Streptomyces sp. VRA16 Mangrove soil]